MSEQLNLMLPGAIVLGVVGLIFKTTASQDTKRKRVYERVDEHKKFTDDNFVRKDMCEVLHNQLKADVTEIKDNVKELLNIGRNGK